MGVILLLLSLAFSYAIMKIIYLLFPLQPRPKDRNGRYFSFLKSTNILVFTVDVLHWMRACFSSTLTSCFILVVSWREASETFLHVSSVFVQVKYVLAEPLFIEITTTVAFGATVSTTCLCTCFSNVHLGVSIEYAKCFPLQFVHSRSL